MTVANETLPKNPVQPSVKEENPQEYSIKLPEFEGPMDLLLHLIKKNEVNISDIPISVITRQYLEYLDLMKDLNLSTVGEFLVLAATLIHIKSKMLLPPDETEEEEEAGDPRADLVRRLLEYQQFKGVAGTLADREKEWRDVFGREPEPGAGSLSDEVNLEDISLFDLIEALKSVMERTPEKKTMEIMVDELSVHDRIGLILDRLESAESITFVSLFENQFTRAAMIVTFLAVLELVKLGRIRILQPDLFGAIRIWKTTNSQPS